MADLKCFAGKCGHGLSLVCLSTLAGILAPLIFLAVVAVVEQLQPGYNPLRDMISKLVLGYYGWFQTLSFFIVGFLLLVFALRLYSTTLRKTPAKAALFFFLLWGIGFFIIGAFPMALGNTPAMKTSEMVHTAAVGLSGSSFIIGSSIFGMYFRIDSRWRKFWVYTVLTAIACLIFFCIWVLTPHEWLWKGLSERLALVIALLWVEIVSVRLLMSCVSKSRNEPGPIALGR